jgi:hypothetical protein
MSTEQAEVQKAGKKPGKEKKPEHKRTTFVGAIKELGIFTYRNDRMSAEAFNSAKQSIIDYLNVKFTHAGYALEHNEHFPFDVNNTQLQHLAAPLKKQVSDQMGKLVADYFLVEIPEAYGLLIGQCEPSLRAVLEEIENFENDIHKPRNLLKLWRAIQEKCLNPIRSDLGNQINVINRYNAAQKKLHIYKPV